MDNYSYTCHYCGKNYIPKRRVVQKYCSNSCRTRAYQLRNPKTGLGVSVPKKEESTTKDMMSWGGFGNAAAGAAAIKLAEIVFTPEGNRPSTKNDLRNLEEKIFKRYYPIKNMGQNNLGKKPHFDIQQCCIIYI